MMAKIVKIITAMITTIAMKVLIGFGFETI